MILGWMGTDDVSPSVLYQRGSEARVSHEAVLISCILEI